ncbi:hypothetical protein GJ496_010163 [Pomphorhynchus laevis]|nr:hypothetical protein GJ496_010163 [Pomphorhynchus laevis]
MYKRRLQHKCNCKSPSKNGICSTGNFRKLSASLTGVLDRFRGFYVDSILGLFRMLRKSSRFSDVYISPDLSPEKRKLEKLFIKKPIDKRTASRHTVIASVVIT